VKTKGGSTIDAEYKGGASAYSPVSVTSNSNSSADSSGVQFGYDGVGNATSSSTSGGDATIAKLTHNNNGTVATATAPGNGDNKTLYDYNSNHQLSTITPVTGAGLGTKTFTYDNFGRSASQSDGAGRTTSFIYDKNDRLLTTSFSDSTPTVTNTYDSSGNLLTQSSSSGTRTNTYDQLSRMISTGNTAGGGTITYKYDKASNQTSSTDSFGTYTNTFDDSGVLVRTKYPHLGSYDYTNYATDSKGRRTDTWLEGSSSYANGADPTVWKAHYQTIYNSFGRVRELVAETDSTDPTTRMDIHYCYNSAGKATTTTCSTALATDTSVLQWSQNMLSDARTEYDYEDGKISKLIETGGTSHTNYAYEYDVRGNRTDADKSGTSTSSQSLHFNAANQITDAGYAYDAAGNLTSTPTKTFTYNAAEQMTSATIVATGKTTTYTYAGSAQNAVLSETTSTGDDYDLVYGRADQNGQPTIAQYIVNGDQSEVYSDPVTGQALMLTTTSGTAAMYVYDGFGSPTFLLTDFHTSAWNFAYDPYGSVFINQNNDKSGYDDNPYLFKGGIQDRGSGLVKFGIRWYNTTTGTWTQQDTLDAPLDPKNGNRYQFAGGDPINGSDPSGRAYATVNGQACAFVCVVAGFSFDGDPHFTLGFAVGADVGADAAVGGGTGSQGGGAVTASCGGFGGGGGYLSGGIGEGASLSGEGGLGAGVGGGCTVGASYTW